MRKILTTFLLLIALPAFSLSKFQGYVEHGGNSVTTGNLVSTTKVQKSFPLSTVTVYLTGTTTLASISSDSGGTPKANPFTADSTGFWFFYGADGTVFDIKFSGTGVSSPWTITGLTNASGGGTTSPNSFIAALLCDGNDAHAAANVSTFAASVTAASAVGGGVVYLPGGDCRANTELSLPISTNPIRLVGVGQNYTGGTTGTVITATSSSVARSVLAVLSPYHTISGIKFDANHATSYGLYFANSTLARLDRVATVRAKLDGMHSAASGINQAMWLSACYSVDNGALYATAGIAGDYTNNLTPTTVAGTAAMVSGNSTITITGGPDLTVFGARKGDFIRVGSSPLTAYYGQIKSIPTSTTVVLEDVGLPTTSLSAQDYAIGIGWGWYEEKFSSNGYNKFDAGSIFRKNGAGGIWMNALYGDTADTVLADFNSFVGIAFGTADNVSTTFESQARHVYMENNFVDYFIGDAANVAIEEPTSNSAIQIVDVGTATTTGTVRRRGVVESLALGAPQNFSVQVENVAGTLKHRIVADVIQGFSSNTVYKVNGASVTYTNTPSIGAGTGFTTGIGIVTAAPQLLTLDTVGAAQNAGISGSAVVEFNSTGTAYLATISTDSRNINSSTKNRTVLYLTNQTTGAIVNWDTTAIPAGTSIAVRFTGYIK